MPPLIAVVTNWFDRRRALAVSLVSCGLGVAPMTVSPFASWLLSTLDWRSAQLTIGVLAALILLPASLLVRTPPRRDAAQGLEAPGAQRTRDMSLGAALRSPPFIVLGLTFFASCAMHSGPIFHTISYVIVCGVSPMAAVSIYSLEGLAGLGGRLLFGVLGDRYGAKRVLVAGLLVQALAAGALSSRSGWATSTRSSFVLRPRAAMSGSNFGQLRQRGPRAQAPGASLLPAGIDAVRDRSWCGQGPSPRRKAIRSFAHGALHRARLPRLSGRHSPCHG